MSEERWMIASSEMHAPCPGYLKHFFAIFPWLVIDQRGSQRRILLTNSITDLLGIQDLVFTMLCACDKRDNPCSQATQQHGYY